MKAMERVHFTYKTEPDRTQLSQGDLLKRTDELEKVLADIHPYFLNEQYKYFIVLTQSCDLVRRDNSNCKSPYITIAAVREMERFFVNHAVNKKWAKEIKGNFLLNEREKANAYSFLERLYNNTADDYFFLYEEPRLELNESMIATLKVSVALKSVLHYDVCLNAKMLELTEEFKAKLGWLVGNIYSRVGTTDWESIKTDRERKQMLNNKLEDYFMIVPRIKMNAVTKVIESLTEEKVEAEEINRIIAETKIETTFDKAITIITNEIRKGGLQLTADDEQLLIGRIKNNNTLQNLIK